MDDIAAAMQALHQQVKKELARRRELERDGPPVQSPPSKPQGGSREKISASIVAGGSTTASQPEAGSALDQARARTLNAFIRKAERRPSFERYPELELSMQRAALAWAKRDTGGNFVLALKKIFEKELLKCFYQTYLVMGGPEALLLKELQEKVDAWKARPENMGKAVDLNALWEIIPNIMPALSLPGTTASALTRNAGSAVERFMQRADVAAEFQNNAALRKVYLHDIRS